MNLRSWVWYRGVYCQMWGREDAKRGGVGITWLRFFHSKEVVVELSPINLCRVVSSFVQVVVQVKEVGILFL